MVAGAEFAAENIPPPNPWRKKAATPPPMFPTGGQTRREASELRQGESESEQLRDNDGAENHAGENFRREIGERRHRAGALHLQHPGPGRKPGPPRFQQRRAHYAEVHSLRSDSRNARAADRLLPIQHQSEQHIEHDGEAEHRCRVHCDGVEGSFEELPRF